jgi:hypothetical protein
MRLQIGALFLIMGSFVMGFIDTTCEANKALQYVFNFLPSYALGKGLVNVCAASRVPPGHPPSPLHRGLLRPWGRERKKGLYSSVCNCTPVCVFTCRCVGVPGPARWRLLIFCRTCSSARPQTQAAEVAEVVAAQGSRWVVSCTHPHAQSATFHRGPEWAVHSDSHTSSHTHSPHGSS